MGALILRPLVFRNTVLKFARWNLKLCKRELLPVLRLGRTVEVALRRRRKTRPIQYKLFVLVRSSVLGL